MAGKLGKFLTLQFSGWKGLTKESHLSSIFQQAPLKASNLMVLFIATYRGKSLETFLSKFPIKEFDSDDEYTWDIVGSAQRNIPLIEARDEDGNVVAANSGMIGAGTAPFYLVFPEDWFARPIAA